MYCIRCGKKLEDGEICTCQQKNTAKIQPQSQVKTQPQTQNTPETKIPEEHAAQQEAPQRQESAQQQFEKKNDSSQQFQSQTAQQIQNYQNQNYQNPNYQQYQQNEQFTQRRMDTAKEAEWMKQKGSAAAENAKSLLKKAIEIIKKPASETVKMAGEENNKDGMHFIIIKGVLMTIISLFMAKRIVGDIDLGMIYVGLAFLVLLCTIGADFLEAFLLKGFTTAFGGVADKNAVYTVVGIRDIYDIVIALITLILSSMSGGLATAAGFLMVMFLPCIQYSSYRVAIHADENKKAYAFVAAKICLMALLAILVYFVGASFLGSAFDELLDALNLF